MNTRRIAAHVLSKVINEGHSLTSALETALPNLKSNQDRAFVQAVCYGVCRYYHRLDFILSQLLDKPLKNDDIKALALVGLYQLSFMRVKPYAAISETVSAVGNKTWARALINALLRNYLRKQETLESAAEQQPLAATSHPQWLHELISQTWPEQAAQLFSENNQQPPMTLRVNRTKISRDDYLQQLALKDISATAALSAQSITLEKPVTIEELPGFTQGLVSIQDGAAQLAAELLDVQPGDRVLDLCAAPGGKTAHLLEQQPNLQALIAIDIDETRMHRVHDNLNRLQLHATQLLIADATQPHYWWDGVPFQRILLDAPCSALGVIRRHPDIKLLRRSDDITQLQALQKSLLDALWPLLAPGGTLLYATCSILKQENEQQAQDFLTRHPDAIEWPIASSWGIARPVGKQIITGESGMDGFYYARFKKH